MVLLDILVMQCNPMDIDTKIYQQYTYLSLEVSRYDLMTNNTTKDTLCDI